MASRPQNPKLIYLCETDSPDIWVSLCEKYLPQCEMRVYPNWGDVTSEPAYAMVWHCPHGELAKRPNIKAIFSLGAGVDHLTNDPNLPMDIPIIRMGDASLCEGMAEYVMMNVLMQHRGMPKLLDQQRQQCWKVYFSKPAQDVRVGIMGYGILSKACVRRLKPFGYPINCWSRTDKKPEDGITHYRGAADLSLFLNNTDILMCLLPDTPDTHNLLDGDTMSELPKGATIINCGRGNALKIEDLINLLDNGHIRAASLDVFKHEPLPKSSPLWGRNDIILTPHIAAITRPETAMMYIRDTIEKIERGERPRNLVDLNRGY